MTWVERRSGWTPHAGDAREPGDIDYGRVIHSAAFRRLQGKTQIHNLGDSDFYRTRLTHSIEVAQIAAGLVRQLSSTFPEHPAKAHLPDHSLIQAISSAHDLGHPPFGHGGETALNYCMRFDGGFEGNGQILRLLSVLENFSEHHGADLSRRALLGILKYPGAYSDLLNPEVIPQLQDGRGMLKTIDIELSKPPRCYLDSEREVVDWILTPLPVEDRTRFASWEESETHRQTLHKSFDCSLMDLADDIAYGVHDFEDALALRFVDRERFGTFVTRDHCEPFLEARRQLYLDETNDYYTAMIDGLFGPRDGRKHWISRLVGFFITSVRFEEKPEFQEPLLRWRAVLPEAHRVFLKRLKNFIRREVIQGPRVQQLEFKGQSMVVSVFEALQSDPERLFPDDAFRGAGTGEDMARTICDFIAGMTDAYLLKTYERLFSPRMGSVFDQL